MEWRKNLYQYEAKPPASAWENIEKELDSDVPAFRNMFTNFEAAPPASAWNRISSALEKPQATPLIWYRRPTVVAAAASLAGIIFLYGYFFADSKDFSAPDVSASVYKPAIEATTAPEVTDKKDLTDKKSLAVLPAPVLPDEPEFKPATGNTKNAAPVNARRNSSGMETLRVNPDDENYIYLVTNSGEVKRVSYKLEKMIPEIRKQDGDKLRRWASKLENAAFIPAGNNFFDIAEMLRVMGEEAP